MNSQDNKKKKIKLKSAYNTSYISYFEMLMILYFIEEIFQGADNKVQIVRKYGITFTCDFDLILYPFDEQHCDMELELSSASIDYLAFAANASGVSYTGNPLLLEYEVCSADTYIIYINEFTDVLI